MTFDDGRQLRKRLEWIAEFMEDQGIGMGDECDAPALREAAAEIGRCHHFISDVAWYFSDYATANWSDPDVLAHVADFFGCTVKALLTRMEDAGQ